MVSWSHAGKLEVWVSVACASAVWTSTATGCSDTSGFEIRRAKATEKWHLRTEERKAEVEIKGGEWVWWHIFQVLVLQCGAFSVGESKPTGLTLKGALTHLKYIHNNPPAWRFLITSPCLLSQALPALTYHISLHFTWYAIPCPKLCLLLLFWHLTTMSQSWLQVCCPKSRIGHPVLSTLPLLYLHEFCFIFGLADTVKR